LKEEARVPWLIDDASLTKDDVHHRRIGHESKQPDYPEIVKRPSRTLTEDRNGPVLAGSGFQEGAAFSFLWFDAVVEYSPLLSICAGAVRG